MIYLAFSLIFISFVILCYVIGCSVMNDVEYFDCIVDCIDCIDCIGCIDCISYAGLTISSLY